MAARRFLGYNRYRKQNQAAKAASSLSYVARRGIAPGSNSVQPGFSRPDPDRLLDIGYEDFAVADPPRLRRAADRFDGFFDKVVAHHDLDLNLRQEVDDVFGAAIELGMTLLPAKALGLGDGDALQSNFLESFLDLVQLERLDNGFYFFLLNRLPGLRTSERR